MQAVTPGQNALGAGLFASAHNSRVLEQFSEAMSGEQGTAIADYERVQMLFERAQNYEQQ